MATTEAVKVSQRRRALKMELSGLSDRQVEKRFREAVRKAVDSMPSKRSQVIASLLVLAEPTVGQQKKQKVSS